MSNTLMLAFHPNFFEKAFIPLKKAILISGMSINYRCNHGPTFIMSSVVHVQCFALTLIILTMKSGIEHII